MTDLPKELRAWARIYQNQSAKIEADFLHKVATAIERVETDATMAVYLSAFALVADQKQHQDTFASLLREASQAVTPHNGGTRHGE